MQRQALYTVAALAVLAAATWLPVTVRHVSFPPKEDPQYIRRVFGEHTVGQTLALSYSLSAIDIAARSERQQTAMLRLVDEAGRELGHTTAMLRADADTWVRVPISPPLPPGTHAVHLAAPGTERADAVLVRFQIQSDLFTDGQMLVNGEPSYGDIGFRTYERAPLWRAVAVWGQITDKSLARGLGRIAAGVGIGIALWLAGELARVRRRPGVVTLLLALAVFTVALRLPYLQIIEGVFGGDAFNYLSKAQALLEGRDPFATDFRKGPLYSFLLLPGFFLANPLYWSRLVGIAAAAGAVVVLTLLGRSFSLPWRLAGLAGVLLAVNPDFIWESPSGLANTLYAALVAASAWAYVRATEARWQWTLAVLLGLTFLTRFEGGAVAAVLLPAVWWREKLPRRRIAAMTAITGLLMATPQISWLWSGQSGIRTADDIIADGGLAVAGSLRALAANVERLQLFAVSTWADADVGQHVLPALIIGLAAGAGLVVLRERRERWWTAAGLVVSVAVLEVLVVLVLTKSELAYRSLAALPWLLIGLGVAPWLHARRYDGLVIMSMLAVQTAIITLILPKPRYYLHLVPFLALFMVFGLRTVLHWSGGKTARVLPVLCGGILASFFASNGHDMLALRAEKYNAQAEQVTAMLLAVQHLRSAHGNVGFLTDEEQTIQTFIPPQRRHVVPGETDLSTAALELRWLQEHRIRYAVERNDGQQWQSAREYPEALEHVHTFHTIHGDSRVLVYLVHQDKVAEASDALE